jgi:predicted ribosome quality control (RQC) complex YloA/Tae2 family protein
MTNSSSNIEVSIDNLRQMRRKLLAIDEETLNTLEPSSQEEWANDLRKITVNINKLETAKLRTISQKFKDKEQDLKDATEDLKNDLQSLNNAIQIIRVISGGLGLITNIIGLLK